MFRAVVINDAETPKDQSQVERVERLHRGFVEITVKPQYSDAINRGGSYSELRGHSAP